MSIPGIRRRHSLAFAGPFVFFFAVFTLWPLLGNAWLAFHDYFLRSGNLAWNGFANFVALARDTTYFYLAVRNSLLLLTTVPLIQILALGLALLLAPSRPGFSLFRVLLYLPVIMAAPIAGIVWRQVLASDGVFNWLLSAISGLPIESMPGWLDSPVTAKYALLVFFCWKHVGYFMVLYLAGLQMVPQDQTEAAMLDGAGAWTRFRHVTLPALQPVLLLCTILSTIAALRAIQEVLVLTGGGNDTFTMPLYAIESAIYGMNFGVAAAVFLLLALVCLALAKLQLKLFGEYGVLRGGY